MRAVLLQHTQEQVPDSVGKSRALSVRPKANAACSPAQRNGHQFALALACRDVGGQLGTIGESGSRERSIVRRVAGLDLLSITVYLCAFQVTYIREIDGWQASGPKEYLCYLWSGDTRRILPIPLTLTKATGNTSMALSYILVRTQPRELQSL